MGIIEQRKMSVRKPLRMRNGKKSVISKESNNEVTTPSQNDKNSRRELDLYLKKPLKK